MAPAPNAHKTNANSSIAGFTSLIIRTSAIRSTKQEQQRSATGEYRRDSRQETAHESPMTHVKIINGTTGVMPETQA
jgi:hypothetical protein